MVNYATLLQSKILHLTVNRFDVSIPVAFKRHSSYQSDTVVKKSLHGDIKSVNEEKVRASTHRVMASRNHVLCSWEAEMVFRGSSKLTG
jgi:hypothetical protein